jgi:WD40 repeat protein
VTAVAVSLDARRIATGSADGLVKVWETDFFHPLLELGGHTGGVRLIRVSADGTRAVTAGDDRTVRVWDLKSGKELRGFRTMAPIDLTPDGTAVVMRMGERTVIRDVLTGLEIIPDSPPVRPCSTLTELLSQLGLCVAISPEGHTIAVANRDGTIGLYEAASGQLRRTLPGHGALCHGLCFTPDGTRLLTAGADQQVLVWAVRMQDLPLPTALQRETRAGKLWTVLASGPADAAYLAMARFAAEPAAAVKMARLRLQPAETAAIPPEAHLAEQRGIELLEALGTVEAREFLEELATGDPLAPSTRAARQALEWLGKSKRLVVGLGRNASLDPPSLFWMR